jgi:hypothetical protein
VAKDLMCFAGIMKMQAQSPWNTSVGASSLDLLSQSRTAGSRAEKRRLLVNKIEIRDRVPEGRERNSVKRFKCKEGLDCKKD